MKTYTIRYTNQYEVVTFSKKSFNLLDAAGVLLSIFELQPRLGTILFKVGQLLRVDGASSFPAGTKIQFHDYPVTVEINSYLLSDQRDRVFVLQAQFNESKRDQDWCPTKPRHAMHCHARVGRLAEAIFQQFKPFIDDLRQKFICVNDNCHARLSTCQHRCIYFGWWKCAVVEHQVYDVDPFCFKLLDFVRWFADPHYFFHIVLLQFLLKQRRLLIQARQMNINCTYLDKSMNGLIIGPISDEELHVFVFDLGGRRPDVLHPHVAHFLSDSKWCNPYFPIAPTLTTTLVRHCFPLILQYARLYDATKS